VAVACVLCSSAGGGRRLAGLVGQKAGWASWPLGRLGRKLKEFLFRIKIRFLNIPMLWKFLGVDLGGILMWGFSLNSFRLLNYFRKV
jgi:hypothetical protein